MISLNFHKKDLIQFTILGMGFGWLLLSYMILENPLIKNKLPGIITLIFGIVSCLIVIIKSKSKKKDVVTGIFKMILAIIVAVYLTLFIIYLAFGLI